MANISYIPIRGHLQGVYTTKPRDQPLQAHRFSDKDEFVVGGTYAAFLRISSFFGLAPLRFKSNGDGYVVSISISMCIYSYLLITLLVAAAVYIAAFEHSLKHIHKNIMSGYVTQIVICCEFVFCLEVTIGLYGAPFRLRRLLKCMNNIALVDRIICAQYSQATERKLWGYLAFFFIPFSVMIATDVYFIYSIYSTKPPNEQHILLLYRTLFYVIAFLRLMLQMQFVFTAMSVRSRIKAVNKMLCLVAKQRSVNVPKTESPYVLNIFARRLVPVDVQPSTVILGESVTGEHRLVVSLSDAVQRIFFLHGLLCDVVDEVNNSYSLIVVFTLVSSLLNLTACPYMAITKTFEREEDHIKFAILQGLWFTLHLVALILWVEPCHYINEEVQTTINIVSRMIMESPTQGALACRLRVFSRQLMLQRDGFKPMGLVTLNRSLIVSFFGIAFTHLVFLFQFTETP